MINDPVLIVVEGPNEVGKTTLARQLAQLFWKRSLLCEVVAFPGNDSGTLGNLVKRIHENPTSYDVKGIEPASLQLLHVAAHIDAIETRILPLLEQGKSIILDRFWWSTIIYGRTSGVDQDVLDEIINIEKQYWDGLIPDKVFLIDRDTPLNANSDSASWSQIRKEYLSFAESVEHDYPVEVIRNDTSIDDAVKRLESSVDSILPKASWSTQ